MMDFKKMYLQKPKRVRDPNLPPPPTLLGQVKELRLAKEMSQSTQQSLSQQQEEIRLLKRKLEQAEYRIDLLTTHLRKAR